jgi:hypothetical protein
MLLLLLPPSSIPISIPKFPSIPFSSSALWGSSSPRCFYDDDIFFFWLSSSFLFQGEGEGKRRDHSQGRGKDEEEEERRTGSTLGAPKNERGDE